MNARALVPTVFFLLAFLPASAHGQQTAQELYQAGLYQEEAVGDLQAAIGIFQTILDDHPRDREVAARAQLHIGLCYELLGFSEAEQAYQAVLDEYGDQREAAGQARARLEALRAAMEIVASDGLVAHRLLEDDGCRIVFMRPSPDGKRIAYSDLCEALAVHVIDLASGETEQITTEGMYLGVVWSPDGRRIATKRMAPGQPQLELIDAESGDVQVVESLKGVNFLPDDWSSDGTHVSGLLGRPPNGSTIIVSLNGGERTELGTPTGQDLPRANFSPDGRFVAFADLVDGNQDIFVQSLATGVRHRVTTDPKADWGAVWSPDGTTLAYHNADGSWALEVVDGQASGDPRLLSSAPYGANQTANSWTSNGYYYAVEKGATNGVRIAVDPESAQSLGPPEPLPEAMSDLALGTLFSWSPDGEILAFTGELSSNRINFSRGQSVTSIHIGEDVEVLRMWWSGNGSELLYTTRSGAGSGPGKTVYALDPTNGEIRELFPPLEARITLLHVSSDGERMVFLRALQPRPDDAVSQVDELVVSEIGNPSNGRVLATSSGAEGYLSTFLEQPSFSPDGSQVMFVRYHLMGEGYGSDAMETSLWVVPADGSAPAHQLDRSAFVGFGFWDPSGRWIVYGDPEGLNNPESTAPLTVISVETGEKHTVIDRNTLESRGITNLRAKAWSPDGGWIGAIETKGGYELWLMPRPFGEGSGR